MIPERTESAQDNTKIASTIRVILIFYKNRRRIKDDPTLSDQSKLYLFA